MAWPTQKWLNYGFKALVLVLMLILLWVELGRKKDLPELWALFLHQYHGKQGLFLALTLLLMPFNWLTETEKWYHLLRSFEPMSRWKALRAVLAGVAVSLFTPNRVGEFGGRILFVGPENRWKAVMINLVGNFAQIMINIGAGLLGAGYFAWRFQWLEPELLGLYLGLALAGILFMGVFYFHLKGVAAFARRIRLLRYVKRFVKELRVLELFNRKELLSVLGWAFLRYSIYATQYFLLLLYFDIKTDVLTAFSGISTLFLLQTGIPLPPLSGLLVRGNLAVMLWAYVGAGTMNSLAATFTLWIINLILPALVGTFSLLYVNIVKTFAHENKHV